MREDLEQQEQLQILKAFWEANKTWIISISFIIIVVISSYNGWSFWQKNQKEKASLLLINVEKNINNQKLDIAVELVKKLSAKHEDSLQRGLGGLMIAKALFAEGRKEDAEKEFRSLVTNSNSGISWLAKIRLAGLLLDMNRPGDVLDVIPEEIPTQWIGLASDRRGDALYAVGRNEDAKKMWERALIAYNKDGLQLAAAKIVSRKIATINSSLLKK